MGYKMKDVDGYIDLRFTYRNDRTVAKKIYREGNYRVSAALLDTGNIPVYFLISLGGGFIEGEKYLQEIQLEESTHAVVTTQTPTYVYKCPNGLLTKQKSLVKVGENAILELYFDEVVPYEDAHYLQETIIEMEKGASVILTDGLTAGWSAEGAPFQYRFTGLKTIIKKEGKEVLNDFLICDPTVENMEDIGLFEGNSNFNSGVIIDEELDKVCLEQFRKVLDSLETPCQYGVTQIDAGIVLRILGPSYHENRRIMWFFTNFYREQIKNFPAINLRKTDAHIH